MANGRIIRHGDRHYGHCSGGRTWQPSSTRCWATVLPRTGIPAGQRRWKVGGSGTPAWNVAFFMWVAFQRWRVAFNLLNNGEHDMALVPGLADSQEQTGWRRLIRNGDRSADYFGVIMGMVERTSVAWAAVRLAGERWRRGRAVVVPITVTLPAIPGSRWRYVRTWAASLYGGVWAWAAGNQAALVPPGGWVSTALKAGAGHAADVLASPWARQRSRSANAA